MPRHTDITQNDRKFPALIGYMLPEFQALPPYFTLHFTPYVTKYTLKGNSVRIGSILHSRFILKSL